jgi:hypothetical protein
MTIAVNGGRVRLGFCMGVMPLGLRLVVVILEILGSKGAGESEGVFL